ncbi:hypothetical protein C0989_009067, partial [Termitomyces sp. Mn162]
IKVSLHTPRNDKGALEVQKNIIQGGMEQPANSKMTRSRADHPLTLPPEPPPSLLPNQSPSGPTPPPKPLPTPAKPPPHPPPLLTTTLGPPRYAANALPATSPPSPSSAATPEADPWTSVPTHLGSMQML